MSAVPLRNAPENDGLSPPSAEGLLQLVHRTSAAARQLRRLLAERLTPWGLSDSELLLLWLCWRSGKSGQVQGDLAIALGISPAQTSALVEGLRKRELLEQHRSALDRRRQIWCLTTEGKSLLTAISSTVTDLAEQLDRQWAPGEGELTKTACMRLYDVLQSQPRLRAYNPELANSTAAGGSQ